MSSKALLDKGLDFPLLFLKGFDGLFVLGTRVPDVRELPIRFIDHLSEIHWYSTSLPRKSHTSLRMSLLLLVLKSMHAAALWPGSEIFCLQVHISRSVVVVAHVVDDECLGLFVVGVDIGDISICGSNRME